MALEFWAAPRCWPGETVFIIAGGPSVSGLDLHALKGRRVIAINSSVFAWPAAEFLYFGDARWFQMNRARLADYGGVKVTTARPVLAKDVCRMRKIRMPPGLALEPDALVMQRTSLSGAINLAVHLGAAHVVLLGADMGPDEKGRTHHHAPHAWPQRPGCWDEQIKELRLMVGPLKQAEVEVVNCSMQSRIDWWPKVKFEEALNAGA